MQPAKRITGLIVILFMFVPLCTPRAVSVAAGQQERYLTILHTNDEHSALLPAPLADYDPEAPNPARGGFARLAGVVKAIRAAKAMDDEPLLLVSGGDYLGGSPFSWLAFEGLAPELSLMIELGYDVITIGNHEFDFGTDVLAEYFTAAGYPDAAGRTAVVAANVHPPEDHPMAAVGITPTCVKELHNGLTVGFFGLIGRDAVQVSPFPEPVSFSDQHTAAWKAVETLRQAGADIVIAVTHLGIDEDRDLARAVPGIDVIVGGHSHTPLDEPVLEGETIIVQSGSLLRNLGVLELAYNPGTGKVSVRNPESGQPHLVPLGHGAPADPDFSGKLDVYTAELDALVRRMTGGLVNRISDIVVYSDFNVPIYNGRESPMGNFVTDALRFAVEEALGEKVHFAFQASGPIRGGIVPGEMPYSRGQVSFFDLANLVGLGSGADRSPGFPVISAYFTAAEVKKILEISVFLSGYMGEDYFLQASGLRATYDPGRAMLNLPFTDLPLPTARAVLAMEIYSGTGIQGRGDEEYTAMPERDDALYHVATDYAVATAIPLVGELVPYFALTPRDRDGNPVEVKDRIVYRDGRELKVWQAVVEYAARQALDAAGHPRIAEYYAGTAGRLVEGKGIPLWVWPLAVMVVFTALVVLFILYRRRRGKEHCGV